MGRQLTTKPLNVLVLCHGNICRSPLAAAVLAKHLGKEHVRSRACKGYQEGRTRPPAAKKVRDFGEAQGYDLSQHRASTVEPGDRDWADLILYMDEGNRERMGEFMDSHHWDKTRCLGEYIGVSKIPDPNYTPRGPELIRMLELVVKAAEACAAELLKSKTPG